MANQNEKPKSLFTFGNAASSTSSPSLFGTTTTSSSNTPTLFGNTTSNTSSSNLFGAAPASTSGPSLFGAATSSSSSNPPLFGATSGTSTPGATGTTPLFGNLSSTTGNSRNTTTNMAQQPPAGNGTPESNKTLFGAVSHTPAGVPNTTLFGSLGNTSKPASGPTLFGTAQPAAGGSTLFGSNVSRAPSAGTGAQATGTSAPAASSIFANMGQTKSGTATPTSNSNIFGAAATSTTPASTTAPSGGLFTLGQTNTTTTGPSSAPLFGSTAASAPGGSAIFGGTAGATAASSAPQSSGLFSNLSGTTAVASTPSSGGLFGAQQSRPSTTPGVTSIFPSSQPATSQAQPATAPAGLSFFPSSTSQASAATTAAPTTTAPSAPAPSAGGGLFGAPKPATTASQPQTSAAPTTGGGLFGGSLAANAGNNNATTTTAAPATTAATANVAPASATSTAAPPAPTGSRLAQKSMDEILTMWSTSLVSHQKAFASLAKRISAWDREMVENAIKVSTLYGRCFQAERDCSEVERQLSNVEHSQLEISSLLDKYEEEVDRLMSSAGIGDDAGSSLGGVDAERERTYKSAEACSSKLNEWNNGLTDMVEEINLTSGKLASMQGGGNAASKTGSDPLGQIVRVLNGHLVQLQNIGTGAQTLREQVAFAQREARNLGGHSLNGGNGWVDDFGRSYLGRR